LELWAAIDLLSGSVVTLKQGKEEAKTTWEEGAVEVAERWEREGADGLHIIDLDAAFGKGSNSKTISKILERAKIPVEVGGGVRSRAAADSWLESGAARVILGTLAYKEPETLSGLLSQRGPERIVVASDYADGKVVVSGWTAGQGVGVRGGGGRQPSGHGGREGRDGYRPGSGDAEGDLRLQQEAEGARVRGHQELARPRRDRAQGGGGSRHWAGAV
jgi:imidazole glycerol phosphate synthase subunit HisF